jgi:hypothetical protein
MSQDQTTLRGSPSITYLDMSDTELDLEMKMAEAKLPRGAMNSPSGTNAPSIYAKDQDLIDFSGPQIMDDVFEEQLSPALEEMKILDPQFDAMTMRSGTVPTVLSAEKEREKHDSMQSTTDRPNLLVLNDPWASSRRTSRASDNLSPLSPVSSEAMGIIAVDRSASVTSSYAGSSKTVASVESEFPEVVQPNESVDPFPSVLDPPSFLPISWQEEEAALETKRSEVLRSGNVDGQLDFAESALHFCAIVKNHHTRISRTQKVTAEETDVQRMLKADARAFVLRHGQCRHAKALFLQSMYFELDQVTSCELQKVALANGYYRAAFYLGNMLEISKATKKALGYYNEGADGGDSACQCVSLSATSNANVR